MMKITPAPKNLSTINFKLISGCNSPVFFRIRLVVNTKVKVNAINDKTTHKEIGNNTGLMK